MPYSIKLRDKASQEIIEAFLWYEEQQEGLGEKFKAKIQDKFSKICQNPFHYKNSYKKYREALTDTFPFLIVYCIDEKESEIIVVALFHTSRNPKNKFQKL